MRRFAELRGVVLAAVAVTLGVTAAFAGLEPDVLPEPLWWRGEPGLPLARDPRPPAARTLRAASEWAPLYVTSDGQRFERERHVLFASAPAGAWRAAVELESSFGVANGTGSSAVMGTGSPEQRTAAFALSREGRRFGGGAALSTTGDRAGWGLSGSARLAPGLTASARWSSTPERGTLDVSWEGTVVSAAGDWQARRAGWRLEGQGTKGAFWFAQDALERRMAEEPAEPGDQFAPELSWLASTAGARWRLLGADWRAEAQAGQGRQRTAVLRAETQYALMAGPVSQALVTLDAVPVRGPLRARFWAGRWAGDARASLSLWPFDGAAAVFGTRRLARSAASLSHQGVQLDVRAPRGPVEGGLALARLEPRADYETWQATLMGMGHDDANEGVVSLRSAWLAGARLSLSHAWSLARVRAEVVQWVPFRIERAAGNAAPAAGGTPATGAGDGDSVRRRGGTLIRVAIETTP